jgi:hypothetical protein
MQQRRMRNFRSAKMAEQHGDALGAHARGKPALAIRKLQAVAKRAPSAPHIYSSLGMVCQDMMMQVVNHHRNQQQQQQARASRDDTNNDIVDDAGATMRDDNALDNQRKGNNVRHSTVTFQDDDNEKAAASAIICNNQGDRQILTEQLGLAKKAEAVLIMLQHCFANEIIPCGCVLPIRPAKLLLCTVT